MSYHILTLGSFVGLFGGCLLAGGFASMLGLGGGFVIVPLLTVFFRVPIHVAISTSLLCIVGTSQSVALAKPSSKYTDSQLGLLLESFTVVGVIVGALVATSVSGRILKLIFGVALSLVFVFMLRKSFSRRGYEDEEKIADAVGDYRPKNMPMGFVGSMVGGLVSSMLGVGGGVIKVPILRLVMGLPFRVATATSNFMIGITATAGATFYVSKGYIDPSLLLPCILGVVIGAFLGGNIAPKIRTSVLERVFLLVVAYFAARMFMSFAG